jgi:hypothetical protein
MQPSDEIYIQPTILGPSYFELFAIYLAEHLNGSAPLIQKLEENPSSHIFYWRTHLLVGLNHFEDEAPADLFTCVMLDVTIRLLRRDSTDQPLITLEFGTILMRSSSLPFLYIKGVPISITDLRQHAEAIGIHVDSTAPKAMAISMGNALLGMTTLTQSQVTFENSSKVTAASLPIIYSDLEETGTLLIKAETTSTLDASTCFMLLQNFTQQDRTIESKETNCRDLLFAVLETWWTPCVIKSSADKVRQTATVSSAKHNQLPSRGPVTRYSRFPLKRKQPGKLSYAKEVDS